jgi:hypothetical protein
LKKNGVSGMGEGWVEIKMETNQAVFADTYWSASSSRHFLPFLSNILKK